MERRLEPASPWIANACCTVLPIGPHGLKTALRRMMGRADAGGLERLQPGARCFFALAVCDGKKMRSLLRPFNLAQHMAAVVVAPHDDSKVRCSLQSSSSAITLFSIFQFQPGNGPSRGFAGEWMRKSGVR